MVPPSAAVMSERGTCAAGGQEAKQGFGASSPAFGTPFPAFGQQGSGPAFGQNPTPQGFGHSSNSAFGSTAQSFGTAKPAFGVQSQLTGAAGQLPAFGAAKPASLPAFWQPTGNTAGSTAAAAGDVGMQNGGEQTSAASQPQDPWLAERFEPGMIPEDPPPPIHCH